MDVARIRYTGPMRTHHRRIPNHGLFHFTTNNPVSTESVEVAEYFDRRGSFSVEWTTAGKIYREFQGDIEEVKEQVRETDYKVKQKIAKTLGVTANLAEEEMNEELTPAIEELKEQMETQ